MPGTQSLTKLSVLALLIGLMALGPLAGQAGASHFRGGNISYQQSGVATNADFESSVAFRCTYFFSPCNVNPGDVVNLTGEAQLQFGDGNQSDGNYTVQAVNVAEDNFVAKKTVSHNYADTTARTAFYSSCCTIGSLVNNASASFKVETLVNLGADGSSPKTSVPPVVNVGNSGTQTFLVPATDPGGQTLRFRLATDGEAGGTNVNPDNGFAIDPATGRITVDTATINGGNPPDGLYHASIVIEARDGQQTVVSSTLVTFLIRIGQQIGGPPVYTVPTPPDGREFTVAPGNNLACDMRATDADAGDTVEIVPGPLPTGFTLVSSAGNPATGRFSFTPGAAQDGQDYVVNFTAQDGNGGSVFRSYTIKVRAGAATTECGGGSLTENATGNPAPVTAAAVQSCDRRAISLVRADVRGRKVVLSGLVRSNLANRSVRILGNYGKGKRGSTLATVRPSTNGSFRATVNRPSRADFATARYRAQVDRSRSAPLKLAQSLSSSSVRQTTNQIEVRGKVKRSLLGKRRTVTVKRLICGRYKTVGSARPDRNGNYVVRFTISAAGSSSLFRAESMVLDRAGSKRYAKAFARAISIRVTSSTG